MSRIMRCRICVAKDVNMCSIVNGPLQEIFEKITNIPLDTKDKKPVSVCYICHSQLIRCQKLHQVASRSDELFNNWLTIQDELQNESDRHYKVWDLTCHLVQDVVSIGINVKCEEDNSDTNIEYCNPKIEIEVKGEVIDTVETEDNTNIYDSDTIYSEDDDIPLQHIKVTSVNGSKVKKKPTVKLKTNRINRTKNKDITPNAREVLLTKEEQLLNLMERAKSLNYLNSPFKCDLCYKGFVDSRAYGNHKEKHDERSGEYVCEICRMRYRTVRQRQAHAMAAHCRQFHCNLCQHRAHTVNQAREHEKWHNGHTYECQLCSQHFRKPTSYLTHMRKRHPTEHVCNVCGESFVGKHGLLMHKSKAHRRQDLKQSTENDSSKKYCTECNIQFVSEDAWKRHILSSLKHTLNNDSRTSCLICNIEVPLGTLKAHLREHEKKLNCKKLFTKAKLSLAKVSCDTCGASFLHSSKLRVHIERVHLGKKYVKHVVCEMCGKKCSSNAALNYHQRTHTGEKPFGCPQCAKRFADKSQLRLHSRTHSGERPYCCGLCGHCFTQRAALSRHYRVHTGVKPYICQHCSKPFSQRASLQSHVRSVHLKVPRHRPPRAAPETAPETAPGSAAGTENGA